MLTTLSVDEFTTLITSTEKVSLLSFELSNGNSVGVGLVSKTLKAVTAAAGTEVPGTTYWSMDSFNTLYTSLSDVSQVGIALTYDKKDTASEGAVKGVQVIAYTLGTDGTLSQAYSHNVNNVRWVGANVTGASINTTYFDSVDVYIGDWTTEGVKEQLKTMLIPEPTTATLSLLALAGLAARRRRK